LVLLPGDGFQAALCLVEAAFKQKIKNRHSVTDHQSSRAAVARRSAFFDMENVYFEDDAGVSPQWLAVRVRLQDGLIPAYRDSFLCSRVPLRVAVAPVPAKQGMAICLSNLYEEKHNCRLPRPSQNFRFAPSPESGLAVTVIQTATPLPPSKVE
jgi:hypothetical protein